MIDSLAGFFLIEVSSNVLKTECVSVFSLKSASSPGKNPVKLLKINTQEIKMQWKSHNWCYGNKFSISNKFRGIL